MTGKPRVPEGVAVPRWLSIPAFFGTDCWVSSHLQGNVTRYGSLDGSLAPSRISRMDRSDASPTFTTSKTIAVAYVTATQTQISSIGRRDQAPMKTPII